MPYSDRGLDDSRTRGYKDSPLTTMATLSRPSIGPSKTPATPREAAKSRIIASYRRKIVRLFPSAKFDEEFVLGCSADQFIDELEKKFKPGMTWENYGETWCVANYEKLDAKFLTSNTEAFYSYFNHVSFEPKFNEELGGRLGNLYRKDKPKGFTAEPGKASPFDQPGD